MAIVSIDPAGDGTNIITFRLGVKDTWNEKRNKVFSVSDDVSDTDINAALGHLQAISNAGWYNTKYTAVREITGMTASAVDALQNSVATGLWLTFEQVSPINADVTLTRTFFVPASKDSKVRTGADDVNWADTDLSALVTFLEDNLATKLASTGDLVIGGWTCNHNKSGFGSEFAVFDGRPG